MRNIKSDMYFQVWKLGVWFWRIGKRMAFYAEDRMPKYDGPTVDELMKTTIEKRWDDVADTVGKTNALLRKAG